MNATIVFDLDGTLVETLPDLTAATNAALKAHGLAPVDMAFLRRAVGHGAKAMLEDALKHHGTAVNDATMAAMHRQFLDYYGDHVADESHLFAGLETAMDALAAKGHQFAVCTNKYEALSRQLLSELGLIDRFRHVVGPDTLGVAKPDPAHLLGTIEKCGGRADRAVMIGDSPADIGAAKAAKVPSVAVTFGYTTVPAAELGADIVIDHFDQLPGAVDRLLGV